MVLIKRYGVAFLIGLLGCLFALGSVRLYNDYSDFMKIRLWVAGIQQQQAQAAQQAQRPQAQPEK